MIAVIGIGAAGFFLGRSSVEPVPAPPHAEPPPSPPPQPSTALPSPQQPLARVDLIAAAGNAADAYAAGQPLPASVKELSGREFELRLPFGCRGGQRPGDGMLAAEYDEDAQVLRLRAQPVMWRLDAWLPVREGGSNSAPAAEKIEGFWISRPWTSSDACPSPLSTNRAPSQPPEQTLGVAQIFTASESRVGRRDGKPYETVLPIAADGPRVIPGLHLRLRGRLADAPGHGPILCRGTSDLRPTCLISVIFEEVAMENAATNASLATWDASSLAAKTTGQ
jgi:hypothetical protein